METSIQEWLNHPAVQSGLIPFIVAILVAELLQRMRLSGLAIVAGFAATVYFVSDFSFSPLTSTRKIILLGLASTILALPFLNLRGMRLVLALAGAAAAAWAMQGVLQRQELQNMLLWGAGCALYVGWLIYWFDGLQHAPVRAASAGMALGFGTGIATLMGASALLGQLGLALGSAASAYLVIMSLTNHPLPAGRSFTLPLSLLAGLLGCAGVLLAKLPWYCLPVFALIPFISHAPVSERLALWLQSTLLSVATLSGAAVAVYLSWRVNDAPPF